MLLKKLEKEIRRKFSNLDFTVNENIIVIKGTSQEVGNIEIEDNIKELIIVIGNFTHWHAACYDESLTKKEKEQQISDEVIDFLNDLFNDKIVMWGSHENGGGFYYVDYDENEHDAPIEKNGVIKYVWSGKEIS